MAGYHKAYEERGRIWITIDGSIAASFCEFKFENAWRAACGVKPGGGWPFTSESYCKIKREEWLNKLDSLEALVECIRNPIDKVVASPQPAVRALGMLDRRLGKRTLAKLSMEGEHDLVRQLYELRCEAEGMSRLMSPAAK